MLLLLAPPNQNLTPHQRLLDMWQSLLDGLQNFVRNDLRHVIGILVLSWLGLWLVRFITERMMQAAERQSSAGLARTAQIRTLASVLRATGYGFIGFFAITSILKEVFDFNAAPLLASAGVLSVAVGLAAQTIIKDVINGMLVLIEDQYNVGDWITIAGVSGNVETMSLRKTAVRGTDGTLYLIPNSQITIVANQNRDFTTTTLNISVDYSANPDKVIALLRKVSMEVRNEPEYKDVFLEDPKVLGVDQIKGPEVIYQISIKTLARKQFDAVRELQRRLRLALEENHMLPGSPYRVSSRELPAPSQQGNASATPDPTTSKAPDVNPFEPHA